MWLTIFMVIISFFLSGCSLVPSQPSTKPDSDSSASPSPISYVGWQEYINDKYHYQIKYPHWNNIQLMLLMLYFTFLKVLL